MKSEKKKANSAEDKVLGEGESAKLQKRKKGKKSDLFSRSHPPTFPFPTFFNKNIYFFKYFSICMFLVQLVRMLTTRVCGICIRNKKKRREGFESIPVDQGKVVS